MESRLRKLLSPRKIHARQADDVPELDLHSVPYTTAPAQGRLPVFINHALKKKTSTVKVTPDPAPPLRALSYESTAPGRAPQLGDRPQRGNGPVKLQTSRRLSSGELLVTQQDYDRTLDDIRQGDYILGGKDRRTSQATLQQKTPVLSSDQRFFSHASNPSRTQPTFTSPLWGPPSSMSDDAVFGASAGGPWYSDPGDLMYPGTNPSTPGLGISVPSQQFYVPKYTASTTYLLDQEERSPTIQALWKAEYSRLVAIYGQAGVNRNISHVNNDYLNKPLPEIDHKTISTRDPMYSSSTHSLHQTLQPPLEYTHRGLGIRNVMSTPHLELGYRDDHSEQSSNQRNSLLSSSGTSSSFTTTRTSMAEEAVTSKDDLRKIVDDMRLTYLQAIEAHTPPLPPLSDPALRKPRSKKQTRSLTSSASVESGLRSASRQSKYSRSKSWQSSTTPQTSTSVYSPPLKSSSRRTSSAPGRRSSHLPVPTLPAIQASPARGQPEAKKDHVAENDDNADVGLKRADSTTLGSMAAKLTILDKGTSKDASASSPTFYNSSGSDSESGPEPTSPALLLKRTSINASSTSVQQTPETHRYAPSGPHPTWHQDTVASIGISDLNVAGDIDDFESLCDDLFSTPASGGAGAQPVLFRKQSWATKGKAETGTNSSKLHGVSTGSPSKPNRQAMQP